MSVSASMHLERSSHAELGLSTSHFITRVGVLILRYVGLQDSYGAC